MQSVTRSWIPFSLWSSNPETITPQNVQNFAQNLVTSISQFQQQIATLTDADQELYNRTVFVDYIFKSTIGDLTATWYTTLQPNSWSKKDSYYNRIFLNKTACKGIDYAKLDEETHIKIDDFMNHYSKLLTGRKLFPCSWSGFEMKNCSDSHNLTKIDLVVLDNFDFDQQQPPSIELVANKIGAFLQITNDIEKAFNKLMNKEEIPLNPSPTDKYTDVKQLPSAAQTSKKQVQLDESDDPYPTNLKSADILTKQSAFNALFGSMNTTYKQIYSFDMRDGGMQFDVTYTFKDTKFVASRPALFWAPFAVVKEYQEIMRQFCVDNSKDVMPKGMGSLELQQDPLSLYYQFQALAQLPSSVDADTLQTQIGDYCESVNTVSGRIS